MEYSLNVGVWNSVFAVPSGVVDEYIKLAGGNSLKVLLYLLRHSGETVTSERMKADLGIEDDGELEDAAAFWAQRGIISAETVGRETRIEAKAPETVAAAAEIPLQGESKLPRIKAAKPPTYSNGEIADSVKGSPEMKMLFDEAEKLYARPLKDSERQMIMKLAEHFRLPCEVSLMLLQYCFKIEKTGPAYISKVAEDWANSEITTVNLANERILALEKLDSAEERLRKALGLSSRLSANMRNFLKTWTVDWGFDNEMIMLAYDKTVDATSGWNPSYANKIIEGWKSAGIATPEAVRKADEEFRRAKSVSIPAAAKRSQKPVRQTNSSFDMDKLMDKIWDSYNDQEDNRNNENK